MITLLFLDSVLDFGAYNGKTVGWVLSNNPSYINWAFKNTQRVNLSLEVAAALKAAMAHPNYREKLPIGSIPKPKRKRKIGKQSIRRSQDNAYNWAVGR